MKFIIIVYVTSWNYLCFGLIFPLLFSLPIYWNLKAGWEAKSLIEKVKKRELYKKESFAWTAVHKNGKKTGLSSPGPVYP